MTYTIGSGPYTSGKVDARICLAGDKSLRAVGWSYDKPLPEFAMLAGSFSFYPALVECTVDGERVRPQPGGFYGGWVTDEIVGPVKGGPQTGHW